MLASGAKLALIGSALGLLEALGVTRLIAVGFPAIPMNSVPVLIGVSVLLIAVAQMARYIPARNASRIGPAETLRQNRRSDGLGWAVGVVARAAWTSLARPSAVFRRPRVLEPWRMLRAEEQLDAVIDKGSPSAMTQAPLSRAVCTEPGAAVAPTK